MPSVSGNVGPVFNGGKITTALTVDPAVTAATGITIQLPAGATGDVLDAMNENTFGLFVDTTGSVSIQGDPASSGRALNVQQLAPGATIVRLQDENGATVLAVASPLAIGFYGTAPVAKPTGVAVSAAGIHAALVTLGLIAA